MTKKSKPVKNNEHHKEAQIIYVIKFLLKKILERILINNVDREQKIQ